MKFFKIRKDVMIRKPAAWRLNSTALSNAFELDDDYVGLIMTQYPISLSFMADEIIDLDTWEYIKSRTHGNSNRVLDEDYKKKLLFYVIGAI